MLNQPKFFNLSLFFHMPQPPTIIGAHGYSSPFFYFSLRANQEWIHSSVCRLTNDSWKKQVTPLPADLALTKASQIVVSLLLAKACCQLKVTLFTGTYCHIPSTTERIYWQTSDKKYFILVHIFSFYFQTLMYISIDYKLHLCDSVLLQLWWMYL